MGRLYLVTLLFLSPLASWAQNDYDYPTLWDPNTIVSSSVDYADGDAKLKGYLAYSNATSGPRPVVIIYPDWDGISNYERFRANLLASMGYAGFVADVYSQSVQQGPSIPVANRSALMMPFRSNSSYWRSRAVAALTTVRTLDIAQKDKIFAIGYCFGGGGVFELARAWPNTPGLLGVGGFHPGPLVTAGPKLQPGSPLRVYAFSGADDPGITGDSVVAWKNEMEAANGTWGFYNYGHTVHAFTIMENPVWNGDKNVSNGYNAASDHASWWALRGILLEAFQLTNTSNAYTSAGGAYDYQTGIAGAKLMSA
uniref:Putative extracellular protein CSOL_020 n=1 Tax=Pseudococcomyxa simplex TaxID=464287 RepID=A0A7L9QDZ8_9CHLO|nr:putative extracellular protein CSOL_020 [Pseudococcomyxa simplex]